MPGSCVLRHVLSDWIFGIAPWVAGERSGRMPAIGLLAESIPVGALLFQPGRLDRPAF